MFLIDINEALINVPMRTIKDKPQRGLDYVKSNLVCRTDSKQIGF